VCFKVLRFFRTQACSAVAVANQGFLCLYTGRCDRFRLAVLVKQRFANDGSDWIAFSQRISQALD
jgi:hypothetical protein